SMVNARTIELLKEMNVKHLAFGAESGSDRVLKMMNKNATVEDNQKAIDLLSSSGLKPTMSLIAGYPDESLEDIALTKQFIERNREKADIIEIYPCIPFPGTSVWDEFVKRNNFASLEEFDWSALSLSKDNIDWSSYHMLTDRYDKKDLIELLEWNEKEKLKDPRLSASQASAAAINHTSPVSTEKCPVCQFKRISFVSTYDNPFVQDERLSLCRCRECSTLFYSPLPSVNYTETFNEEHDKFYIEHDAGLLFMASLLYPLKDIKPKNMLDIGCGLGFAMDIGRDLFGIDEVLGFEPSYGKRLKVFDANIIDGYFPNDLPFENRKFDLILSSEVLEHTIDPKDFLQQIVTLLSENGTAILSTPNANAFFLEDKEQIGIAGPGQHTIIFSEESIYEVLGELDVSFKIFTSEGQSGKKHLIIYLTRSIIASGISYLKPTDPAVVDYLEGYLEKQYAKLQSKDVSSLSGGAKWLYFGVLARLVEIKVNKGNYPQCTGLINNMIEALKVQYQIDVHNMSSAMKVIRKHGELSFFEYMKVTPAFFSKFLFIYGIWLMNYQQEYKNACSQFAISAELAGIEIAFPFYNANQVIIDLANKHLELARSNANQVIIDLANKHLELARSKISSKFYNLLRDNLSLFIRKLRQFYCKR
nr:methyltransferase domain-containing protein [Candidatus Brocadiales bacterium]